LGGFSHGHQSGYWLGNYDVVSGVIVLGIGRIQQHGPRLTAEVGKQL
jgi:hypothetical protein